MPFRAWRRWREDLGTVRPLADDRVILHFGTTRPSRTQFQGLADDPGAPGAMEFHDEVKMCGTGLYVLLYDGATGLSLGQVLSTEEAATFVRALPEGFFYGSRGIFLLGRDTARGSRHATGYLAATRACRDC